MTLELPVVDKDGYEFSDADLTFLGIDAASLSRWSTREAPLTVPPDEYRELCSTLIAALRADNIQEADIRLQGSSVRFFSSSSKPMLYEKAALIQEFLSQYQRLPTEFEAQRMMQRLNSQWATPGPTQRPFDAMFVIGAAKDGSDLDFQVSSNDIRRRLQERTGTLGTDLSAIQSQNSKYNFFVKDLTESAFIHVSLWRTMATELVRRPVSVAMFDGSGPPTVDGPLSSHFKDDDWMVVQNEQP
jgi:hypothetical protein